MFYGIFYLAEFYWYNLPIIIIIITTTVIVLVLFVIINDYILEIVHDLHILLCALAHDSFGFLFCDFIFVFFLV